MGTNQDDEIEIDLKDLFYVLKRRIWIILLTGILGAVGFGLFTVMVMNPVFTSSTMLYIVNKTASLPSLSDLQLGTQLTKDYKVLVTSRPVTAQVIAELDLNMSHEQLVGKINVQNPADTRILTISVEDSDPYMAKSIADKMAAVASDRMAKIMDTIPPKVVEEGHVATRKTRPSVKKNVLMGGIAGAGLSATVILILFIMNDTVKTPEDVEKYLGLNTLSAIPVFEENALGQKKKRKRKKEGKA
jgi:capsular polysaccharide biosynthesis protein